MKITLTKPVKIFFTSAILLAILGILFSNYSDRKMTEQKNQESKDRMLYGSKEKAELAKEEKAEESKNRLLHGANSDN